MNKKTISKKNENEFSRYLSYLLRHNPGDIGLTLMKDGWVKTVDLINAINNHDNSPYMVTLIDLKNIVEKDNKKRYSFKKESNDMFAFIRANQGHSIKDLNVDFRLVENPPEFLYHGTSEKAAQAIMYSGEIKPMSRQMVHLSKDMDKAMIVGKRHGVPVLFRINTKKAISEGKKFYISENGVYLVDQIDLHLIELVDSKPGVLK